MDDKDQKRVNEETELMTTEELPDYLDKMFMVYKQSKEYNKHYQHMVHKNGSDELEYI